MITSLKFNNCFAFNNTIEMGLKADMRTKKFSSNITNVNDNLNILKSAVIYGPNNTGKTTLINCIKAIKGTLLNKEIHLDSNIFTDSNVCEEAISFIYDNKEYSYKYKFDDEKMMYIYERMCEIVKDQYNNEKEELIFLKDTINEKYECPQDEELEKQTEILVKKIENQYDSYHINSALEEIWKIISMTNTDKILFLIQLRH